MSKQTSKPGVTYRNGRERKQVTTDIDLETWNRFTGSAKALRYLLYQAFDEACELWVEKKKKEVDKLDDTSKRSNKPTST